MLARLGGGGGVGLGCRGVGVGGGGSTVGCCSPTKMKEIQAKISVSLEKEKIKKVSCF